MEEKEIVVLFGYNEKGELIISQDCGLYEKKEVVLNGKQQEYLKILLDGKCNGRA